MVVLTYQKNSKFELQLDEEEMRILTTASQINNLTISEMLKSTLEDLIADYDSIIQEATEEL